MIYLIPRGKRTYGRVIWEGTFADVPVTSFLVYAEESLNLKRDFNSHWVLNLGSVKIGIKCFSRFLLEAHGRKPSKPHFHGPIRL